MKPKKPAPVSYSPKQTEMHLPKFSKVGVLKNRINPVVSVQTPRLGSLDFARHSSVSTAGCCTSSKPSTFYTGTMVKGITVVHKSCLMPVFTNQEAKDFASMRR